MGKTNRRSRLRSRWKSSLAWTSARTVPGGVPRIRWYSLLTSLSVNACVCVVRHSKEEDGQDVIIGGPIGA